MESGNGQFWIRGPDRVLNLRCLCPHRLIGLTNHQMLELLGSPSNFEDTTKHVMNFHKNLIPLTLFGKNLVIQFNQDSIIAKAFIEQRTAL